jgi:hypothetical protein
MVFLFGQNVMRFMQELANLSMTRQNVDSYLPKFAVITKLVSNLDPHEEILSHPKKFKKKKKHYVVYF